METNSIGSPRQMKLKEVIKFGKMFSFLYRKNLSPLSWNCPQIVTLLPAVLLIWFTTHYFVEIPFWDEFRIPRLMTEIESGSMTLLGACWRLHNEHRLFFPTLIMLELAKLTAWNIRVECWIIFLLATGCFYVIRRFLIDGEKQGHTDTAVMVSSFLFFSESQWENWLWGFQIGILLMEFCLLLALYAVTRTDLKMRHITAAVVFSFVGSFSFANGLLTWPLIALALLLRRPRQIMNAIALVAMYVAILALYFHGYKKPEAHPNILAFVNNPREYIAYSLMFLGHPIGNSSALILGSVAIAGFIAGNILCFKKNLAVLNVRIALMAMGLFSIGSAIIIGLGRVGFGADQAFAPRYITIANLLWLSDIAYLYLCLQLVGKKYGIVFQNVVTILCLVAMMPGYIRGWQEGKLHYQKLKAVKIVVLNEYPAFKDETLVQIYPLPSKARERLIYMAERKLSLFHKSPGSDQ